MNETGSYPGQPWLWLFQLWYHVKPFSSSDSVDIWAVYLTGLATVLLLAIPFIPGLRDVPEVIPVHRLIWRSWNRRPKQPTETAGPVGTTTGADRSSGRAASACIVPGLRPGHGAGLAGEPGPRSLPSAMPGG